MHPTHDDFRARLLEAERSDPALRDRYEKEIQAMIEKKLTAPRKLMWTGSAVLGATFAVVFGTVAITAPAEFPMLGRIGFIAGAVFGVAWVVLAVSLLRKGTINLRLHPTVGVGMVWGFTVIMVTLFMVMASKLPDPITGVQMVLNGVVFLIMAALFMISNRVDQAQLKTQERLLEIEYRIAELSESMERRS